MTGWRPFSSLTGGTVACFAPHNPAKSQRVVAGSGVGVHESLDGGRSWSTLSVGTLPPPVEVLAGHGDVLFAGCAGGLYKSADGGHTWRQVLTECRATAAAVAPDYAESGLVFAGTERDGIVRSDDGGTNWTSSNPGLLDLSVLALALSPEFARDHTGFAATTTGLYRTRNAGKAWRIVALPVEEPAVECLAVSPSFATDRLVLAGTDGHGLLISRDAGAKWAVVSELDRETVTAVHASATTAGLVLLAATPDRVLQSLDGGESWQTVTESIGPVLCLAAVSEANGKSILAGRPSIGVARIAEGGHAAEEACDGLAARLLLDVAPMPVASSGLCLLDLEHGVLQSTDRGQHWSPTLPASQSQTFAIAATREAIWAAGAAGLFRLGADASWQHTLSDRPYQTVAATDAAVLAVAQDGGLLLSTDGRLWRTLRSPSAAAILSVAVSPAFARDRTLFIATLDQADVTLWRSTDGGNTWRRWLVTPGAAPVSVVVSPDLAADGRVYVSVGGRLLCSRSDAQETVRGERRPMWHETTVPDTEASITGLCLSLGFAQDGALWVSTSRGVWESRDRGASLALLSDGLGESPVICVRPIRTDGGADGMVAVALGGTLFQYGG
ncbi:MAG: hypothetical protein U0821_23875 [Chloroflexota bacterium]